MCLDLSPIIKANAVALILMLIRPKTSSPKALNGAGERGRGEVDTN